MYILEFLSAVKSPVFCRLRDIHHARLYSMFMVRIIPMHLIGMPYLSRRDPAVFTWKRQDFMPDRLYRSGLMYIHMPGHRRQHSLMWAQDGGDHRKVGLCPAHKEMYIYIHTAALVLDPLLRTAAERIFPIPRRLDKIRLFQLLYDGRVRPFQIITFKSDHNITSPFVPALPAIHAGSPADALQPSQAFPLYNTGSPTLRPPPPAAGSDAPAQRISSFPP